MTQVAFDCTRGLGCENLSENFSTKLYSSHYPAIHPIFFFVAQSLGKLVLIPILQCSTFAAILVAEPCSVSMLLRSREGIGTMEARCSFRSIAISIQLRRMISHRHLQSNEGHSGRLHLLLSSSRLSPSSLAAVCRIAAAISSYIRPSRPF